VISRQTKSSVSNVTPNNDLILLFHKFVSDDDDFEFDSCEIREMNQTQSISATGGYVCVH
jgi:hypothetical protein